MLGHPPSRGRPDGEMVLGFVSPKCAALSCPGRSAARSGALQTRDRSSPWRSRISGAPLHFVTRCTASGTRDTDGHSSFLSHDLQQHTLPRRGALLRERDFAEARAGWSDPCIFLFFCRFGSSILGLTISNNTHSLLPAARFLRPGLLTFASLTRIEGRAERRETFGCCAKHPRDTP